MTSIIASRAAAAAASVAALLALPRASRPAFRPIPFFFPEIAQATAALAVSHPHADLVNVTMADGSGFAEVRDNRTYGVLLSSERYSDSKDLASRLAAMATVAQRVLAGEVTAA